MRAAQPVYTAIFALLTVMLATKSSWVLDSLYFQRHTAGEMSIALGALSSFIIVGALLLHYFFGKTKTIYLANLSITILLSYFGWIYIKQIGLLPTIPGSMHKMLALILTIAAASMTHRIAPAIWGRIYPAVIAAGMLFILSPWIIANTNAPTVYWPSPSNQSPTVLAPSLPKQNTIVLLLDELSANAAGPVVEQLQTTGLKVTFANINPAGRNTINVIPAIWSGSSFDQAVACGPTQLCNATKVLDFAKTKASSENIDIVGFYHHYCAIRGLRSCYFEPTPSKSAGLDLICSFPTINNLKILGCETLISDRNAMLAMRNNMRHALTEAPFWRKGGILYAHILAPHPLMGMPLKPLNEEYADNIAYGALLAKLLAQKAKAEFGDDFRIIVFSDHPLRPEIWCADKNYIALKCKPDPSQISTQVPLIIASPYRNMLAPIKINNNKNVFDLLF